MIKLICADLRRILKKRTSLIIFIFMMLFLLFRLAVARLTMQNDFSPVAEIVQYIRTFDVVMGIVIFSAIYSEDFRAMSYITAIGRGVSRDKVVIAKLCDTMILMTIFYGIAYVILTMAANALGCKFEGALYVTWNLVFVISMYKAIGYIALASMFLYMTNNIPLGTIVLVVLYIVVPVSGTFLQMNDFLNGLHLDRIHYAGLADNAMTDFLFGNYPAGIFKLVVGLCVYFGLVFGVTRFLFEKKELEF